MSEEENTYKKLVLKNVTMNSFVLNPFLLVVKNSNEKSNVMTVSYVGVASEVPPIITLSIRPSRFSYELICKQKEFTLNFPSLDLLPAIDYCGTFSGKKVDKIKCLGLKTKEAEFVNAEFILGSPLVLECKLISLIELSKTKKATHDLFIAEVCNCLVRDDFNIETFNPVVTTNYSYRTVGKEIGKAHKFWHKKKNGG